MPPQPNIPLTSCNITLDKSASNFIYVRVKNTKEQIFGKIFSRSTEMQFFSVLVESRGSNPSNYSLLQMEEWHSVQHIYPIYQESASNKMLVGPDTNKWLDCKSFPCTKTSKSLIAYDFGKKMYPITGCLEIKYELLLAKRYQKLSCSRGCKIREKSLQYTAKN